jgi:hypothetical protein
VRRGVEADVCSLLAVDVVEEVVEGERISAMRVGVRAGVFERAGEGVGVALGICPVCSVWETAEMRPILRSLPSAAKFTGVAAGVDWLDVSFLRGPPGAPPVLMTGLLLASSVNSPRRGSTVRAPVSLRDEDWRAACNSPS